MSLQSPGRLQFSSEWQKASAAFIGPVQPTGLHLKGRSCVILGGNAKAGLFPSTDEDQKPTVQWFLEDILATESHPV